MSRFFFLFVMGYRKAKYKLLLPLWRLKTRIQLKAFNVQYNSFQTQGVPYISVTNNGRFVIGRTFRMNNNYASNIIGRQQPCIFIVSGGSLSIGDNVGISSTAIICHNSITIGNNVRFGGNTVIYDTDFHSLKISERIANPEIKSNIKTAPVSIGDNVFIGGHSTIMKGVIIGENSIIGAGSLVTKNVPPNEIWAGNPAKYIKQI